MDDIFPRLANFHLAVSLPVYAIFSCQCSNNLQPRDWLERSVNLVYLSQHEHGGHFPANNVPMEWTEEVRTFFTGLRNGEF